MSEKAKCFFVKLSMKCVICQKSSAHICGGCGKLAYCGDKCADEDWANGHHVECIGLRYKEPNYPAKEINPPYNGASKVTVTYYQVNERQGNAADNSYPNLNDELLFLDASVPFEFFSKRFKERGWGELTREVFENFRSQKSYADQVYVTNFLKDAKKGLLLTFQKSNGWPILYMLFDKERQKVELSYWTRSFVNDLQEAMTGNIESRRLGPFALCFGTKIATEMYGSFKTLYLVAMPSTQKVIAVIDAKLRENDRHGLNLYYGLPRSALSVESLLEALPFFWKGEESQAKKQKFESVDLRFKDSNLKSKKIEPPYKSAVVVTRTLYLKGERQEPIVQKKFPNLNDDVAVAKIIADSDAVAYEGVKKYFRERFRIELSKEAFESVYWSKTGDDQLDMTDFLADAENGLLLTFQKEDNTPILYMLYELKIDRLWLSCWTRSFVNDLLEAHYGNIESKGIGTFALSFGTKIALEHFGYHNELLFLDPLPSTEYVLDAVKIEIQKTLDGKRCVDAVALSKTYEDLWLPRKRQKN